VEGKDIVVAETRLVIRIVTEVLKPGRRRRIHIRNDLPEARSVASRPESARRLLDDGIHRNAGGYFCESGAVGEMAEGKCRPRLGPVQANVGSDPEPPPTVLVKGENPVPPQAARVVGAVSVSGEGFRIEIQPVQPAARRPDPKSSVDVLEEAADVVLAERRGICGIGQIAPEGPRTPLPTGGDESVEAAPRPHPENTRSVLQERGHGIVTQARGIQGIVPVMAETARDPVKKIEPPGSPDPKAARTVFVKALDLVADKAVGVGGIVFENGEPVSVVEVQAVQGPKP
jgi:hypothetical protein